MTHLTGYSNELPTGNEVEEEPSRRHSEPQRAATQSKAIDDEAVYKVHQEKLQ